MAAYPTFDCGQAIGSTEDILDDLQVDRASNGTPRIRAFYSATKKQFSVLHPYATSAEKVALDAFYAANRLISFTFVWAGDGATYTCYFAAPPRRVPVAGVYWEITSEMVQA